MRLVEGFTVSGFQGYKGVYMWLYRGDGGLRVSGFRVWRFGVSGFWGFRVLGLWGFRV